MISKIAAAQGLLCALAMQHATPRTEPTAYVPLAPAPRRVWPVARGLAAVAVGLAIGAESRTAEASGGLPLGTELLIVPTVIAGGIGLGGAVAAVLSDSDAGRPGAAARTLAIAGSALNLGLGPLYLVGANDGRDVGLGVAHLALGAADLGLILYRATRPPQRPAIASWSVAPLAIVDAAGQRVPGAGLRVVAF